MGLLSFIKDAGAKILGGDEPYKEPTAANKSISSFIRDHGIDPSGLKFFFNADSTVKITGTVDKQELKEKIVLIVGNIKGIAGVHDFLNVASDSQAPVEEASNQNDASLNEQDNSTNDIEEDTTDWTSRTYTVASGDTLWKISQTIYGNGAKYTEIFEANKPMLKNPDKIYPGQVLRIPPLD